MVAVFGMGEDAGAASERLLAALRAAVAAVERRAATAPTGVQFAPPPPWGELVMTPREAFLGPQEVVPIARGGRAGRGGVARRLPAGDPERAAGRAPDGRDARLHRSRRSTHGGSLRGASDRELRTLRVALES